MAYTKGTYPQLIGGISEQVPQARHANQVQAQLNMLSDPVTGPRRRGGFTHHGTLAAITGDQFKSELYEIGGDVYALVVRTDTGKALLYAVDVNGYSQGALLQEANFPYAVASSPKAIQYAKHGSGVAILNTEKTVQLGDAEPEKAFNPARLGYFYVQTGALDTEFSVQYQLGDGTVHELMHKTPPSGATDATPIKIATELHSKLVASPDVGTAAGWEHFRTGAYVFSIAPAGSNPLNIQTQMGDSNMRTSRTGGLADSSQLPARLPKEADGYVMRTGKEREHSYFEWDYDNTRWNERAAYGRRFPVENLPWLYDLESRTLNSLAGEGRLAGDEDNSPDPFFIGKQLTGVGSFQGRLALLCREYVFFTASKDEILWRKSAASISDDDPIEIAGVTSYGLSYKYAVPFMGDLLLLSESAQALIPGNVVLTPRTASLSVASEYQMTLESPPIHTGKSLLFAAPSTSSGSALWEMVPSEYTNRNLYAQDITEHVPRLHRGKVQQGAVLDAAGYVLILDESDRLKVHQYLWAGPDKVHSSFSEWQVSDEVLEVHAAGTSFWLFVRGHQGAVRLLRWQHTAQHSTRLHVDRFAWHFPVQPGTIRVPKAMFSYEELMSDDFLILQYTDAGTPYYCSAESVTELNPTHWHVHSQYIRGTPEHSVGAGMRYRSVLQPTAPVLRDYWNQPILLERAVLHTLTVEVQETGNFTVSYKDRARPRQFLEVTPHRLYTTDLDAGEPAIGSDTLNVPLRTDLRTAEFRMETNGPYDMWIAGIEYGYRHNQRFQRAVVRGASTEI